MKKTKFNPDLLKEELNRFKLLNEYDFYQEKKELPEYKELILGDLDEADEAPDDLEPADTDVDNATDNIASDLGVEEPKDSDEETTGEIPEPEAKEPEETEADTAPKPEANSDEVEVDVTSLVKGSEEAKHAADIASHNSEILLQKLNDLESRVASMTKVSDKIEKLEKEIIKRNPTPIEKLEMRSLSSYPYSQKLTDYWAEKEGPYDVMNKEKEKKEYVLTKDDVDNYSDADIKKSFTVDKNEFDEEEM
jgi:hypothetical protein